VINPLERVGFLNGTVGDLQGLFRDEFDDMDYSSMQG
jgi:hypothetical protein